MRIQVEPDGYLTTTAALPEEPPKLVVGSPVASSNWVPPVLAEADEAEGRPELPETWMVQRWRVDQGLPQNSVRALHQTRDGYLWIGTASGLARFDGRRFVVFDDVNTPVLRETTGDIRKLTEDRDGRLLVGAARGVVRLEGGRFRAFGIAPPHDRNRVRDLAVDVSNRVWVATDVGLRRIVDGQILSAGIPEALARIGSLAVATSGTDTLWHGGNSGLMRWRVGGEEVEPLGTVVDAMAVAADGTGWMRGPPNSLVRVGPMGAESVATVETDGPILPVASFFSTALAVTDPGRVYAILGSRRRLHALEGGRLSPVRTGEGGYVDHVTCVILDREGALWCGTRANGLLRVRRRLMHPILLEEPAGFDKVLSVTEGRRGSIWYGTVFGMVQWSRDRVRLFQYPIVSGALGGFAVSTVPSGMVWAGFTGGGVIQLGPTTETLDGARLDAGSVLDVDSRTIRVIFRRRSDGWFFLGDQQGLRHIVGEWEYHASQREPGRTRSVFVGGWKRVGVDGGWGQADVRAVLEDRSGSLWVGSYGGGITRITGRGIPSDPFQFATFTTEHGLSHDRAWYLHEDADGVLWIGTSRGLNRYKDGRFFAVTRDHGLFDDLINHFLEDDQGRFWIGSNRGIFRVHRDELNAVADGRLGRVRCVVYGEADGMLSAETNGENQHSAYKASDGRLYFATQRGLITIDPHALPADAPPPPLMIEQVLADGDPIFGEGTNEGETESFSPDSVRSPDVLRIPAGTAHALAIRYTAGSLSVPERVRFEHRLVGLSEAWVTGNSERVAYYNHLEPGKYRFEVRAANHHGVWNEMGAVFPFVLEPHFWQTRPFYALCGLVLVSGAAAVQAYRLRFQRKVLQLQQQHAVELERTRIARDIHDRLGANLSRIALTSAGPGVAQTQVRETLHELRELIWSVHPKNDSLSNLADFLADAAQRYLEAAGIAAELDWPSSIPAVEVPGQVRQHVASAFKEALRNVVQHSGARKVRIAMHALPTGLQIEIADDGCGFDPDRASGNGLRNLRARMEEIGGECRVETGLGRGTTVAFRVPNRPSEDS